MKDLQSTFLIIYYLQLFPRLAAVSLLGLTLKIVAF